MHLPDNVSEAIKRLNPQIYGGPMGGMAPPKREPSQVATLEQKPQARQSRQRGVVVVVTIIACRHRILDEDNAIAGAKPLRDAIARTLGFDDADPRIRWQYGQQRTDGEQGTIVLVERL